MCVYVHLYKYIYMHNIYIHVYILIIIYIYIYIYISANIHTKKPPVNKKIHFNYVIQSVNRIQKLF